MDTDGTVVKGVGSCQFAVTNDGWQPTSTSSS